MNTKSKSSLAANGESLASLYLSANGYTILQRNFYSAYGEIDIIACLNNELVFVEIKTRSNHSLKSAENTITISKQKKITLTAMHFIAQNPEYADYSCRFDVILVFYYAKDDTFKPIHYQDAFKPVVEQNNDY